MALPLVLAKESKVLLFLGGPVLPDSSPFLHLNAENMARWASCMSTAVYVDRLKDEVRKLRNEIVRQHDEERNGRESLLHTLTVNTAVTLAHESPPLDDLAAPHQVCIPEIVGRSAAILAVRRSISVFSGFDLPVLIEGESGTGKELVARAIHRLSERSAHNFVSENCGAIPANLVETEFFGCEKGAFTGATESKPGMFEVAHRGTVFLDEIGEMDLETQKKLLRVLQEGEIRRVGSRTPRRVDFRVISATNRVLEDQIVKGQFREDLYFRLNVAAIALPPLRDHPSDIPLLVDHFNQQSCTKGARPPLLFSEAALERLTAYPWPGNVRELQNEILRLTCTGLIKIGVRELSGRILRETARLPGRALVKERPLLSLAEIEKQLMAPVLAEVLKSAAGNRAEAARRLRITRSSLYRRMKRYGIKI